MIQCIMTEQKAGVDLVLDESDAALRAELGRLESERKRMTARLDERISQIRSILKSSGMLPLFAGAAAKKQEQSAAEEQEPNGDSPRGKKQKIIYEFLLKNPTAGYRELVRAVYGDYTESKYNSARNAVRTMKQDGWITGEPGEWKIAQAAAT